MEGHNCEHSEDAGAVCSFNTGGIKLRTLCMGIMCMHLHYVTPRQLALASAIEHPLCTRTHNNHFYSAVESFKMSASGERFVLPT